MNIWDTAGKEMFYKVPSPYIKYAHAAIIIYAVDEEESFVSLDYLISKADEHGNRPKMVKIIVGNKSDVDKDRRKIMMRDAKRFADHRAMEYFETSGKVNDGSVNDVFSTLAGLIKKSFSEEELTVSD